MRSVFARQPASGAAAAGENYAALMELERLYVQISADTFGISAGLLRIPFGYGIAWGPMDFLNPRNPLEPDARLRGVLGITGSWYPAFAEGVKFLAFAAAPQDPFAAGGGGARFGLAWDRHGDRASVQVLYVFESPASYTAADEYPQGLHRAGFSFKAELELGLEGEFLYTLNPAAPADLPEGLAASFGADYTFFDGKLYVLAEYLYSGSESTGAQSAASPTGRSGNHYLYGAGTWKWSDFASFTLGCAANLEDLSATPLAAWEYQFAQGLTVSLKAYVPLDRESFGGEGPGEYGPRASGSYAYGTAGLRVKF